jgi:hypothetical protein
MTSFQICFKNNQSLSMLLKMGGRWGGRRVVDDGGVDVGRWIRL